MSKGQHQGKIVIGVEDGWVPSTLSPANPVFRRNASYLFTGATRGVGLHVAAWAVSQGARHIILTGSSGRLTRLSELSIDYLKQRNPDLRVSVIRLDLSDASSVRKVFEEHANIRGVFHFATQYTAQSSDKVTVESIADGYSAKGEGARHLHDVTSKRDLDIFFMSASTAGLFGNQNQPVYAAANGYLQWLAGHRRRMGLPAVALDLPIMLGAGRLSEFANAMELEIITGKGWQPMSVQDVSQVIGQLLATQTATQRTSHWRAPAGPLPHRRCRSMHAHTSTIVWRRRERGEV
jgi:myxalamid-type polyketide synthase MxaB